MREGEASAHSGAASSWAALSPLSFLERSADVWADRPAVKLGDRVWTYREHADRVGRAAAALVQRLSVRAGDRVAVILPNVPAMLELHYAVPGVGAVLVPLNTRLSGAEYEYVLAHSGAGIVFADSALRGKLETGTDLRVVWVEARGGEGCEYEAMVEASDSIPLRRPDDERSLLSINYTSGTTGRPKGVMAIHRGSYLQTMGVIAEAA